MNATRNEASDRCLQWALAEDLGGEQAPDLVAAVCARAAAGQWPDEAEITTSANWRIAAFMAAGIAVAVGTWLAQRPRTEVPEAPGGVPAAVPQDPPPGKAPPVAPPVAEPMAEDAPWVVVSTQAEIAALQPSCLALRLRTPELEQVLTHQEAHWKEGDKPGTAVQAGSSPRARIASVLDRTPKLQKLDADTSEKSDLQLDRLDLDRIGAQSSLRWLSLAGRTEIEPAWLRALAGLPALTHLALPHVRIGDEGAAALAPIPALQSLDLAFELTLTDDGLTSLATMPGLRHLSLRGCVRLTSKGLQRLGDCRLLERLDLRFCNGLDLEPPRGVPKQLLHRLEQMMMSEMALAAQPGSGLDDAALEALAKLTRLRELLLTGCPTITANGLRAVAALPLRKLSVSIRTGTATEWVGAMPPMIEELSLAWSSVFDDDAAGALAKRLPQLQKLDLFQCSALTDRGLQQLLEHTALVELDLRGCAKLTAGALPLLLAAKSLQVLDVSGQRWVDDAAAAQLRGLPALRELRNRRGGTMVQLPR
ncbi:MAG TPA: hypothetical protein VF384_09940 [Planctomycetota bacterium]